MKIAIFTALIALTLPVLAHADQDSVRCTNEDKTTDISVSFSFQGSYDNFPMASKTTASMTIARLGGKASKEVVSLAGEGNDSNRGPYFDLSGDKSYSLFIAAPASGSSSSLSVGDLKIDLICE